MTSRLRMPAGDAARVLSFLLVGGLQFALDAGLFVGLTWLGMAPAWANISSRLAAACVGFFLNGRLTFGHASLTRTQFGRYVASWVLLTVASTMTVAAVAGVAGLRWAWLAKVLVEVVLAAVSFLLMRNWVFSARRR